MKIKNIILILVLALLAIGAGIIIRVHGMGNQASSKAGHHDLYYCPMHPQILYDHPGHCPICGMDLVKKVIAPQEQGSHVEGYTTVSESAQRQELAGVNTALVIKKEAIKTVRAAGQYVSQVYAQVFEDDLQFIKVGQEANVEIPAYGQTFVGIVSSIDSMIDPISRTIRVRIWLKHQVDQRKFKANMFVNVEFPVNLGMALIVPRESVMDTGLRKIIFVCKGGNSFEPREIQTGWETDDGFEVKSGLKEGDRIVVSGNFLLDSESRVQAGEQADSSATTEGDNHGK